MQGLGAGSLLGAAREAAYGEISTDARAVGRAEIVGMETWEKEGQDETNMTPRARARHRARRGRRFLREAVENAPAPAAEERQLGPSIPAVDPYGSYHLPLAFDTDRLPYGARPSHDEPHIVLEYRELIPKLDKPAVRLFAEGGGKRYLEECRKTEEQVQAERLAHDTDLTVLEAIEIRDEAAAAEAAYQACLTQLDSKNYSATLIKRLEDQRNGTLDAKRPDFTDIYNFDPAGLALEEMDSDDDSILNNVEMSNANVLKTFKVHRFTCQIPEDYLDLQRQFVALHPKQYRPLSIERPDGSLVQPNDKNFADKETIVFREYGIYPDDYALRPARRIKATPLEKKIDAERRCLAAVEGALSRDHAVLEEATRDLEGALIVEKRRVEDGGPASYKAQDLTADIGKLEARAASVLKEVDDATLQREACETRLAAAVRAPFDWEREHAEACRDAAPLRDADQPPVLAQGDRRQGAIPSPRAKKAHQASSLASQRLGSMRAGRAKATPFNLDAGAGRWYVSGCGR